MIISKIYQDMVLFSIVYARHKQKFSQYLLEQFIWLCALLKRADLKHYRTKLILSDYLQEEFLLWFSHIKIIIIIIAGTFFLLKILCKPLMVQLSFGSLKWLPESVIIVYLSYMYSFLDLDVQNSPCICRYYAICFNVGF